MKDSPEPLSRASAPAVTREEQAKALSLYLVTAKTPDWEPHAGVVVTICAQTDYVYQPYDVQFQLTEEIIALAKSNAAPALRPVEAPAEPLSAKDIQSIAESWFDRDFEGMDNVVGAIREALGKVGVLNAQC